MWTLKGVRCLIEGHDWGPWWLFTDKGEYLEVKRTCRCCRKAERRNLPKRPLTIRGDEELLRLLEQRTR